MNKSNIVYVKGGGGLEKRASVYLKKTVIAAIYLEVLPSCRLTRSTGLSLPVAWSRYSFWASGGPCLPQGASVAWAWATAVACESHFSLLRWGWGLTGGLSPKICLMTKSAILYPRSVPASYTMTGSAGAPVSCSFIIWWSLITGAECSKLWSDRISQNNKIMFFYYSFAIHFNSFNIHLVSVIVLRINEDLFLIYDAIK